MSNLKDKFLNKLKQDKIQILSEYINLHTRCRCVDENGYIIYINPNNYIYRDSVGKKIDKTNDYSIDNINNFFRIHSVDFVCITKEYTSARDLLQCQCNKCKNIIDTKWINIQKAENDNLHSRHFVMCPNCDGRTESLHALVLKQMFIHEYPNTIVEELSCRNPITNKLCPTDIVNHELKIAIEIQSEYHDNPKSQAKDKMKRDFWMSKGYYFFDPDIRDYTILEMCQLFFDIDSIPDYIDYNYANKLNIKDLQNLLNQGYKVTDISKLENINAHRIYDAIYSGKLYYPEHYKNNNHITINQYNLNHEFIKQYESITQAAKDNGICPSVLIQNMLDKKYITKGYIWEYA